MNRKEIINNVRCEGNLKGAKPAYVLLGDNKGHLYKDGNREFIMSIKGNRLYFQRISRFLKVLKPNDDFIMDLNKFKKYRIINKKLMNVLYLFAENPELYMEINYPCGTADTVMSADNIVRMTSDFKKLGIINIDEEESVENNAEESNTEGKGPNQEIRNEEAKEE